MSYLDVNLSARCYVKSLVAAAAAAAVVVQSKLCCFADVNSPSCKSDMFNEDA